MIEKKKSSESSEKSSEKMCLKGNRVQKVQKKSSESSDKSSENICLKGKKFSKFRKKSSESSGKNSKKMCLKGKFRKFRKNQTMQNNLKVLDESFFVSTRSKFINSKNQRNDSQ